MQRNVVVYGNLGVSNLGRYEALGIGRTQEMELEVFF
jgi:hypothetical protein